MKRIASDPLNASLGSYAPRVDAVLAQAAQENVVNRIWKKDDSLWKSEEAHRQIVRHSLGWLNIPAEMSAVADDLMTFANRTRQSAEFDYVMVCGMGGSSLCPEVLTQTFGPQPGYPRLLVLDSTDPDVIDALEKRIDIQRCLFIIASKSGTTTEPLVFYKYWYDQVSQRKVDPGNSFVAITDPGTRMVEMATKDKFQRIFLNPADIGGRYSALSYFGLVPAALMGLDIKQLLAKAMQMLHECKADLSVADNPGARLGAILGECARAGRDKLTIVADEKISTLGLWIEQLVAESTGKEGKGIVPVQGERLGTPAIYNDDRIFVSIAVGDLDIATEASLEALQAAGHPVAYRRLKDLYDLGQEFFLWEFATAFAGWFLAINPFDQPNVQESKDATRELLDYFSSQGKLQEQTPLVADGTMTVYAEDPYLASIGSSVLDVIRAHLSRIKKSDYIAILVYIEQTAEIEEALQVIRARLRNITSCATTIGYGPRFLHSTGQLHKGGPDTGVFIQLTAADKVDRLVPGESYTFSILKQAQALGDFRSLASRRRRAIRVDLGENVVAGLGHLRKLIETI